MATNSLVILAAGMGSRYGGNKQIDTFGPNGEILMDYSIYDAWKAGYKKVIFIIRQDFADAFIPAIEKKWAQRLELCFAFQSVDKFLPTDKQHLTQERTKPWGTGHAILCAQDYITDYFTIINADDFYGKEAYTQAFNFATQNIHLTQGAIVAYNINNTLSLFGQVSRGVCKIDTVKCQLISVEEKYGIHKQDGKIVSTHKGITQELSNDTFVSMNFWVLPKTFLSHLNEKWNSFLQNYNPKTNEEFLLPTIINNCISNNTLQITYLNSQSQWFGVTYKEDAEVTKQNIKTLIQQQQYPDKI